MTYRDPRNGEAVDAVVDDVLAAATELTARLRALADLLGPAELTPGQASRLADGLATVGLIGAAILTVDMERTAEREGRTH